MRQEPGRAHVREHVSRTAQRTDRARELRVELAAAGERCADPGRDLEEVGAGQRRDESSTGHHRLEHDDRAAGSQRGAEAS